MCISPHIACNILFLLWQINFNSRLVGRFVDAISLEAVAAEREVGCLWCSER